MWNLQLRVGIAEFVFAAGLLFLGALVALFVIEWPVGLVPALTYGVALVWAYTGYRVYSREQVRISAAERVVRFRVIETRGVCPYGREKGELITVSGAHVSPFVCDAARTVLSVTASGDDGTEWCCPIYEHMLVFRQEKVAA